MTGHAAEPGAAVLEHHPGPRRDDPGAERLVDALDERDGHAVPVHHAEVGGAAARQARPEIERGIRPHERATGGQPLLGEGVGWQRAVVDERVGVGERELHRLDLEVRARLETVVQRQREQRRNPLAVRRQLAHLDAAVAPAQRLDPLGGMGAEIVLGEPGRRRDRRRDLALVERIRPLRRDPLAGWRRAREARSAGRRRAPATARVPPVPTCGRSAPCTRRRRARPRRPERPRCRG